ncbi:CAF1 family ribonuclease [Nitzschia inconspicua]|uniref:CAF1 family ribonuclease n=1 Tax=Nitzschia inconspicua TaxID=303405 RepID=A0A9K3PPR1_9STRA|nr:CAF1 family ribonuclease [Nitzschia inconspicua]
MASPQGTIEVTKSNFVEKSNDFIKHLPNASFIAIDEEMTGISLPPNEVTPLSKEDSPAHRYSALKRVPERYSIIQLGISLFEQKSVTETAERDAASFIVRRYKFTMFPGADPNLSREITMHPSAMHFLRENNMSFDTWVQDGIPFCTKFNAQKVVERFLERHQRRIKAAPIMSPNNSQRLVLSRDADKQFHARCITRLREWLDAPLPTPAPTQEGVSLLLPRCNSFLRRSLYEAIQRDYPYLVVETENEQIRVWRLTDDERANRNQRLLEEDFNKYLTESVGVYRIFLALTKACRGEPIKNDLENAILAENATVATADFVPTAESPISKIPLVVHNGLMDLLFLMSHFHSPILPGDWVECKDLIHSYFPVIYDTKVLSTQYCAESPSRSHLQAVYEDTLESYPEWQLKNSDEEAEQQAHDAAFDAYMTGVSFCGLTYTIHNQCEVLPTSSNARFKLWEVSEKLEYPRWLFGRNKLHFHLSPFTIDLETHCDPLGRRISALSTFRVSNINRDITTRDILDCVRGLTDSNQRAIHVDLFWVNDTVFLVGARITSLQQSEDQSEEIFRESGKVLRCALEGRFCNGETIELLVPPARPEKTNSIWNLWGLLGSNDSPLSERPAKRRRTE